MTTVEFQNRWRTPRSSRWPPSPAAPLSRNWDRPTRGCRWIPSRNGLARSRLVSYVVGMNRPTSLPTSPQRMTPRDTGLLVVDVQQKLAPLIQGHERIEWNIRRLLDAARLFEMQVLATEQYPQGLGPTVPSIAERLTEVAEKTRFSCGACGLLFEGLLANGIRKLLVCGIETHVCVQQTSLDLITAGFEVYLAADAVGSRFAIDHETGPASHGDHRNHADKH